MFRSILWIALALGTSVVMAVTARAFLDDADRERLQAAYELLASQKFDAAAAMLAKVEGDPARSEVALEARLLLSHAKNLGGKAKEGGEIAAALERALPPEHPARGRALSMLAEAYAELGKTDESVRVFADLSKSMLGSGHRARVAGAFLAMAAEAEKERPGKDAISPKIPADPAGAADLFGRALLILSDGKPVSGVTLSFAWNLLASGRAGEAINALVPLLELKDLKLEEETAARHLLSEACFQGGDLARARTELGKLLAMPSVAETPFGAKGLLLLGEVHRRRDGSIEAQKEAVATWRKFLSTYPDHASASNVRQRIAETLYGASLADEAILAFEDLAKDERADKSVRARASFGVAEAHRSVERFDQAREAIRRFLSLWPDDARVPEAQALLPTLVLEKAEALRRAGDTNLSIGSYQAYVDEYPLAPNAATVAVEVGLLFRQQKKYPAAIAALRQARDRYFDHQRNEAARAAALIGVVEEDDYRDLEAAALTYQKVVETFGGTPGAEMAQARLTQMKTIELELASTQMFAPGEPVSVKLTTRNVKTASFRIYRLNAREYFERRGTLDGAADIEVALVKSDRAFNHDTKEFQRFRRDREDVSVELEAGAPLAEGAYLVAVEAHERRSVVLVLVSSIRLVVKESPFEVFVWAVDAKSGEPKEGVEVLIRGAEEPISIKTSKDGVARTTHKSPRGRCEVLGVLGGSAIPGLPEAPAGTQATVLAPRVSFLLDRPIYRPGTALRWRAILREVKDGILASPEAGRMVAVRLIDSGQRVLAIETIKTGALGTAHGEFLIPPDSRLGDWSLQLDFAAQTFAEKVVVAEYQKPDYLIRVQPKATVVRPGDEVEATIDVSYFFGGPLQNASFEWSVRRARHTIDTERYLAHSWYLRAIAAEKKPEPSAGMELISSGGGVLSQKGQGTLTFRTQLDSDLSKYVITVAVRDASDQWVVGSGVAFAGERDRFAVVLSERKTVRAGETVEVRVVTADLSHRPVQTKGRLSAMIRRPVTGGRAGLESIESVAVDTGLRGESTVRIELKEAGAYVLRFEGEGSGKSQVLAEAPLVVTGKLPDVAKEATCRFEREVYRGGETARMHLVIPEANRPVLLTFETSRILGYRILRPEAASLVHDIPIEESYAPNVVAAVAFPWKEKLLTSEDHLIVLRYLDVSVKVSKTQALPGEKVEVSLFAKDQTGTPVRSALALRATDAALGALSGSTGEDPRFVFNKDVAPHLVRTGSSMAFSFVGKTNFLDPELLRLVREEEMRKAGKDLAGLEVFATKKLAEGLVDHEVAEESEELAKEDPADRRSADEKSKNGIGGGGGGHGRKPGGRVNRMAPGAAPKPMPTQAMRPRLEPSSGMPGELKAETDNNESFLSVDTTVFNGRSDKDFKRDVQKGIWFGEIEPLLPRKNFVDVAGWWPAIETDAEGKAAISLQLPENLTTFEFLCSGASAGAAVGQGETSILVTKPIHVRVDAPRYLGSADVARVPVLVHSNLDEDTNAELSFRTLNQDLLSTNGATEASFELKALGVKRTDIGFAPKAAGVVTFETLVRTGLGNDGSVDGLRIVPQGESWSHVVHRQVEGEMSVDVEIPFEPVPGSERYRVHLHADLLAEVLDGLTYLGSYPHGCLEQSINRFYPAIVLHLARRGSGLPPLLTPERLDTLARSGLASLTSFQNADGGFGYWPGRGSEPFTTAMALEALVRLREAGFPAPPALTESTRNAVVEILQKGGIEADARAALALALVKASLTPDAALNALVRDRAQLSVAGLSRAVLAANLAGRSQIASQFFSDLKSRLPVSDPRPSGRIASGWHSSVLEADALRLLAHAAMESATDVLVDLKNRVRAGLTSRDGSTKAVALAVESLAAYVATAGERAGAFSARVLVDGKEVGKENAGAATPSLDLEIPAAALTKGKHRIQVLKDGGLSAQCRIVLKAVRPDLEVAAGGNVLSVSRRFVPYRNPEAKDEEFAPGTTILKPESRPKPEPPPSLTQALTGSKVTVLLTMKAREDASYIVLEDPLLAGIEPIANGVRGNFDRFERRDDRMVFYKNRLKANEEIRISYPCYVILEGKFHAPPARAEEMYAPERYGNSPSSSLTIFPEARFLAQVTAPKPSPDEIYSQGRAAFREARYEEVVKLLEPLRKGLDLREEIHDEILNVVSLAQLRTESFAEAVKVREELEARNPGKFAMSILDRNRLGQAYLAVANPHQAKTHFEAVILDRFREEMKVVEVKRQRERPEVAAEHLQSVLWRYPQFGEVLSAQDALASEWLGIESERNAVEKSSLPAMQRSEWRRALTTLSSLAAWSPKSGLAEHAGFRKVQILTELAAHTSLITEAGSYLERYEGASRGPEVNVRLADALFELGRFEDAGREALATRDRKVRFGNGLRVPEESPHADQAAYILGKVAHVAGDYAKAVEWYGKVRQRIPDAEQSYAFFTMRELKVASVQTAAPDQEAKLLAEVKNLKEVKVQLYPVDLSVLFAVKKSFDLLNTADLSGILPAEEKVLPIASKPFSPSACELPLGKRAKGAYLVVLRSGDKTATTLLLVTDAALRVQREAGMIRVYLVDGQGKPVAGARIKLAAAGRIFHSGVTDARGLLDTQDPGSGTITVVAELSDLVAVATRP